MVLVWLIAIALVSFFGLTALVIALTSTPWQILLLFLLVILFFFQRLIQQIYSPSNQQAIPSPDAPAPRKAHGHSSAAEPAVGHPVDHDQDSVLSYRGAKYHTPPINSAQESPDRGNSSEVAGKYRGCEWKSTHSAPPTQSLPLPEMKYRGAKVAGSSSIKSSHPAIEPPAEPDSAT